MLISKDGGPPDVTESAIKALAPSGVGIPGLVLKPKANVAGRAAVPDRLPRVNLVNTNSEKLSLSIDALWTKLNGGKPSSEVIVTTADPALSRFALPAGSLAAKTGSPVFFVGRDTVPLATLRAIQAHKKPHIYVVGPPRAISDTLLKRLKRFGPVRRIGGDTPTENAVQVAIFADPITGWGWNIISPGHGLVVMNSHREMDAAAAATLSSGAAYGPLLLNASSKTLDLALQNYLLDIKPAYRDDPSDGVYNRAWLLGDEKILSPALQASIDKLCEIVQVTGQTGEALAGQEGL
ncbi:MAG: cell wall-binding repeat-containing protein [Thermoleophilia bacterium]|nr:cell wall-binding repeat-containing protein [Thermoleophilia bacterium]